MCGSHVAAPGTHSEVSRRVCTGSEQEQDLSISAGSRGWCLRENGRPTGRRGPGGWVVASSETVTLAVGDVNELETSCFLSAQCRGTSCPASGSVSEQRGGDQLLGSAVTPVLAPRLPLLSHTTRPFPSVLFVTQRGVWDRRVQVEHVSE